MLHRFSSFRGIVLLFCFLSATALQAQENTDTLSSDGLFMAARKAAFDHSDYTTAKRYLHKALGISPDYADIRVFLGRIFTWNKQYDSARFYFNSVLQKKPDYEDALSALADLEYWNDNNTAALQLCDSALRYHPDSEGMLVKRGKILNSMKRYADADKDIQHALRINHNNTEARALANRIKENASKNKIGLSYDYVYFDKQFADPWHLASFDYTRTTGIGSVTGRINYANRFKESGVQYELEAYPRISNTFYSYVDIGYSDKVGVFPHWRGGFSLYANLPASFEGELGIRYLKFSGDPTWIYTAYLGKYYKSWLFGFRTYLTPSIYTTTVSSSYTATARYYYGSADDVIGFSTGYGISPDDRQNAIQLDGITKLTSYKAGLSWKKKLGGFNVIGADFSWFNQEYLPQTKGNQYQISIGWLYRF
jgi:YaiO family outer membrane protein